VTQRFTVVLALCTGVFLQPAYGAVQNFPVKPVRIVVPSRPAGAADAVAQVLSKQLREAWKAQVVIDHRPGPGGKIGAQVVAKAPADGYTTLLASTSLATTPALYRRVSYDPGRDLVAVAGVAISPFLILVQPAVPVRSVNDLIALAKKQPDKLAFGCAAPGSEEHLCGELLSLRAGVRVASAFYETRGDAITALLSGKVPFAFSDVQRGLPHVNSGKVRAVAITSPKRHPGLPDVAAVSETLPGYECAAWLALFAPAKTPALVREKIEAAVTAALRSKTTQDLLRAEGLYAYPGNAEDFDRFFRAELPKWARVARESGIELD
jgi:tripartite-type tricarboxylate transporter receptor subunit TctC